MLVVAGPSSTTGTTFPLGTVPVQSNLVGARLALQAALKAPGPVPLTNSIALVLGN